MSSKNKNPYAENKKKKQDKKKDKRLGTIISVGVGILLIFVGLFFLNNYQNESKINSAKENGDLYGSYKIKNQATIDQLSDENYQDIILPEDLESKIESGEGTFVYFFSPTCIHCKNATPDLMNAVDASDVKVNQYNILEFDQGWDTYNIEATPTLVYFKDGKEQDRLVGGAPEKDFKEFIDNNK